MKNNYKRGVMLQLFVVLLSISSHGQTFTWKSVNIQGIGYVTGLIAHPDVAAAPNLLYARTDVGGAYRYESASNSWKSITDIIPLPSNGNQGIESIAIDPKNPNYVYMAVNGPKYNSTAGDVWFSSDKGATWESLGLESNGVYVGSNDLFRGSTGERLMVDPNNSNVIYFSTRKNGLWKYTKNGSSGAWAQAAGGLPSSSTFCKNYYGVCFHPGMSFVMFDKSSGLVNGSTKTIYVGNHDPNSSAGGVWQSTDGGATWSQIGTDRNPLRASIDKVGTLYVSFGSDEYTSEGAVRKYSNGSWTTINPPGGSGKSYTGISVDPNDDNIVMVMTNFGELYRSVNKGQGWITVNRSLTGQPGYYQSNWGTNAWGSAALVIDPNNSKRVWSTNGFGVLKTEDITRSSSNWQMVMKNFEESCPSLVITPPVAGGVDLMAGIGDIAGLVIKDKDVPPGFEAKLGPEDVSWITSMDYVQSKPNYTAFAGWNEVSHQSFTGYSSDNGKSWTEFASKPATGTGGIIAISSTNEKNMVWWPNKKYEETTYTPAHYTKDGGNSWTAVSDLPVSSFYRTVPNWSGTTLVSDRVNGNKFYALTTTNGANPGFYVSTNGGQNWTKTPANFLGLAQFSPQTYIRTNPLVEGDIWICSKYNDKAGKLYHSTNSGTSFTVIPNVTSCNSIGFGKSDCECNNKVFIYMHGKVGAATDDGIYLSKDMGETWTLISNPEENVFGGINYVEGDMREVGIVYVVNPCRGIFYGKGDAITAIDENYHARMLNYISYLADNSIKVNYDLSEIDNLEIHGVNGIKYMNFEGEEIKGYDGLINCSRLTTGLYIMKFMTKNGDYKSEKFMVK